MYARCAGRGCSATCSHIRPPPGNRSMCSLTTHSTDVAPFLSVGSSMHHRNCQWRAEYASSYHADSSCWLVAYPQLVPTHTLLDFRGLLFPPICMTAPESPPPSTFVLQPSAGPLQARGNPQCKRLLPLALRGSRAICPTSDQSQ